MTTEALKEAVSSLEENRSADFKDEIEGVLRAKAIEKIEEMKSEIAESLIDEKYKKMKEEDDEEDDDDDDDSDDDEVAKKKKKKNGDDDDEEDDDSEDED